MSRTNLIIEVFKFFFSFEFLMAFLFPVQVDLICLFFYKHIHVTFMYLRILCMLHIHSIQF
jgi:hypothetical protein